MIGLKYLLAVRSDLLPSLLPACAPTIRDALADSSDDVKTVAADALGGVAAHAPALLDAPLLATVLGGLWDALLTLDELSAAAARVMEALALYAAHATYAQLSTFSAPSGATTLIDVVPRLWPFLRHPAAAARSGAMSTLATLLKAACAAADMPPVWLRGAAQLTPAARLLVQAICLDTDADVQIGAKRALSELVHAAPPSELSAAIGPHVCEWLRVLGTPLGATISRTHLLRLRFAAPEPPLGECVNSVDVGGEWDETSSFEAASASEEMHSRGAAALGLLAHASTPDGMRVPAAVGGWHEGLLVALAAPSATARQIAAWVVGEWASLTVPTDVAIGGLESAVHALLVAQANDASSVAATSTELKPLLSTMQADATSLFRAFESAHVPSAQLLASSWDSEDWPGGVGAGVGEQAALALTTSIYAHWLTLMPPSTSRGARSTCANARARLIKSRAAAIERLACLTQALGESACEALVRMRRLPPKLNPLLSLAYQGSLMSTLHGAGCALQARAASVLAALLQLLVEQSKPNVVEKLAKNLCTLLTPPPQRQPLPEADATAHATASAQAAAAVTASVGAQRALQACCSTFGDGLFEALPPLWQALDGPLSASPREGNSLRAALRLCRTIAHGLTVAPAAQLLTCVPHILAVLLAPDLPGAAHVDSVEVAKLEARGDSATATATATCPADVTDMRVLAADVLATCCDALGTISAADGAGASFGCDAMEIILTTILPSLDPSAPPASQLGGALCLRALVTTLQNGVLPFAALLIAPLTACLSSSNELIRTEGAAAFGILVPLLPLEPGTPNPAGMSVAMAARKAAERPFVDQLLGLSGARPPKYDLPVVVQATLRPYQQAGVDWLAFLRRFGMHGILCDDMGLGKTLQTLCGLSAAAHERRERAASAARAGEPPPEPMPSLVVCPPTLTGHWLNEARKFCPSTLHVLEVVGSAAARAKLLSRAGEHELVILSYETLRSDIEALVRIRWDYAVLDEGHVIRNRNAKVSIAAKRLVAARRLILSGTPLQNHAVELWSLFDFLMPNYLGSHAHFGSTYARPIHASLGAAAGDAEQLKGEAALARLHRQVRLSLSLFLRILRGLSSHAISLV